MTVDGQVRPGARVPLSVRVLGIAITVAVLCAALSIAAIALWVGALLVPIAIVRRWRGAPPGVGPIVVRWPPR